MAKRVQLIRLDSVLTADFLGKDGEITVNTSNRSVHVHDGATKGGTEQARYDLDNSPDATVSTHGRMPAQSVLDIQNAQADIIQNAADIAQNVLDIAANLAAIQSNDTDIATLNTNLTQEISDRIAGDNSVTSAFQAADATLQTQINTNATNISSNDTDIANLQSSKADKVIPATANSIALLNASGNLAASNKTFTSTDDKVDNFPAGTVIMFPQAAAPTGWTKSLTHHNKALRIVNDATGGGSGGTSPWTSVFGAAKVTLGHSLTVAQMPAHDHGGVTSGTGAHSHLYNGFIPTGNEYLEGTPGGSDTPNATTGGTGAHNHNIDSQGNGSVHSHGLIMDVTYVNAIIASKN